MALLILIAAFPAWCQECPKNIPAAGKKASDLPQITFTAKDTSNENSLPSASLKLHQPGKVTFHWQVKGASPTFVISPAIAVGKLNKEGNVTIAITSDNIYCLLARDTNGKASKKVTVAIIQQQQQGTTVPVGGTQDAKNKAVVLDSDSPPASALSIVEFKPSSDRIATGSELTISWNTSNALNVSLDAFPSTDEITPLAPLDPNGQIRISHLTQDTTFTLTAIGADEVRIRRKFKVGVVPATSTQLDRKVIFSIAVAVLLIIAFAFVTLATSIVEKLGAGSGEIRIGLDRIGSSLDTVRQNARLLDQTNQQLRVRNKLFSERDNPAARPTEPSPIGYPCEAPLPVVSAPPPAYSDKPLMPVSTYTSEPPQAHGNRFTGNLVADYNLAMTMDESERDAAFLKQYPHAYHLACPNLDQVRGSRATPRFERDDRGNFLVIDQDDLALVVPSLNRAPFLNRRLFDGIFQYPEPASPDLRLTRPATLNRTSDSWTLDNRGEFTRA